MTKRTKWEAAQEKMAAVKEAENRGEVADSMDVRMKLMRKVKSGELTLAQAQEQLKKIKRAAKGGGQITRAQAWRQG